jgi:hypothetical protein
VSSQLVSLGNIYAALLGLIFSRQYPQQDWLGRPVDDILGRRFHHWMLWTGDILGTRFLLSSSVGVRGCVFGASLPETKVVLSHSFCCAVGDFVF